MNELPDGAELFLSDARGIYIPRDFANSIKHSCVDGVTPEDWAILEAGPELESYWDTWADVMDNATLRNPETGVVFTLYQDGDLWLVPEGAEWPTDEDDDTDEDEPADSDQDGAP